MKKIFTFLAAVLITATIYGQDAQVGKVFVIDTTVATPVGFDLSKTAVQFRPNFAYGASTTVVYEFRTFVDTVALNRGDSPLAVYDREGTIFARYSKTYTLEQFMNITPQFMYNEVKAILEEKFGDNIIQ